MTGLFNAGSAFFQVESDDVLLADQIIEQDLVSLTVTEEMHKMDTGELVLRDPTGIYANVFRVGTRLSLAWGYLKNDEAPSSILGREFNVDEVTGSIIRQGMRVRVHSPGGSGASTGERTFRASFLALDQRGSPAIQTYSGSKRQVISQVLAELDPTLPSRSDIRFAQGGEEVEGIQRWETVFKFLTRLSFEWRAVFRMGFDARGQVYAIFVDPQTVPTSWVLRRIGGGAGLSHLFDYGGTVNNVIEYSWKDGAGDSGFGDNVRVEVVNGQIVFTRFVAEGPDRVAAWRLNPQAIEDELDRRGAAGGTGGQLALVREVLRAQTFAEVERFFEPVQQRFAPQGYGYFVEMRTLGNPTLTAGGKADFGSGFPPQIGSNNTTWYLRRVQHMIDAGGYMNRLQVVDAFAISEGTGIVLGSGVAG